MITFRLDGVAASKTHSVPLILFAMVSTGERTML